MHVAMKVNMRDPCDDGHVLYSDCMNANILVVID